MENISELLTTEEFANRIGVSVPTIRRYIDNGLIVPDIDFITIGKHRFFFPSGVSKFAGLITKNRRSGGYNSKNAVVVFVSDKNDVAIDPEKIADNMLKVRYLPFDNNDMPSDDEVDSGFEQFLQENKTAFFRQVNDGVKKGVMKKLNSLIPLNNGLEKSRKVALLYKKYVNFVDTGDFSEVDKSIEGIFRLLISYFSAENADENCLCKKQSIPDENAKGRGYAEVYNSVLLSFQKQYRVKSYHQKNRYSVEKIQKDDLDKFKLLCVRIINGYYDEVYIINKDKMPDEWSRVIEILDDCGVCERITEIEFDDG